METGEFNTYKRPRRSLYSVLCGVIVLFLTGAFGQAATGINSEERTIFTESVVPLRGEMAASARAIPGERLADSLEIEISLRMRNSSKFTERIAQGRPVPDVEMERDFLPGASDYVAIQQWLESEGFVVTGTDSHRLAVFARGTVEQIRKSLQVEMVRMTKDGIDYNSANTNPSLPKRIAAPVLGINGLQPYLKLAKHQSAMQPQMFGVPYQVNDILGAYNATGLGVTGSGQTIAILIDTAATNSDLTSFWNTNGVARTGTIEIVNVNNVALPVISGEETLDEEWSSGIAPGAKVRVYATGDLHFASLDRALLRIISDLPTQPNMYQLSISLGLDEADMGVSQMQTDSQYFAILANAGVSVFVSSGDGGSNPTRSGGPGGNTALVEYYASDPNVTGVGGTTLTLSSSTGAVMNEIAWTDSGGGASTYFARPTWQTGTGVPSGTTRLVPDVSLDADINTGVYVIFSGAVYRFGGTSVSAPVWAGFCALINEARTRSGFAPVGLLNSTIYPLLGTSGFRDITSGSNGAYTANGGYDRITGVGVPNMAVLFQTLSTQYLISTSASPANCGATSGSGTYVGRSTASVTATPNSAYAFTNWTENGSVVSASPTYSFTVTGDRTLVANFTPTIPANILTPVADSTLSSTPAVFVWNAGTGVSQYALWVGNAPQTFDLYAKLEGTALNDAVAVPTDGRPLYVTLWSSINGTWQANSYPYTAFTNPNGPHKAAMLSPVANTTLSAASTTFSWNAGKSVSQYLLWVGSSPLTCDLYSKLEGNALSDTVKLPADGRMLYVTLWSTVNGLWQANCYVYTAWIAPTPVKAAMASPVDTSTLGSGTVTFSWTTGTGVSQYMLWVGSAPQAYDCYAKMEAGSLSDTVTVPTDGRTLYVTLWSSINGTWQANAYLYTAFTSPTGSLKAAMLSPSPDTALNAASTTFTWSAGRGVSQSLMWVGSAPLSYDLYAKLEGTALSDTIRLPIDGRMLYVTLWSQIDGAWQSNAYSYRASSH